MTRSYRTTPICGMTTATSEKDDKRRYNRCYRRVVRQRLRFDPIALQPLPLLREHSNPWLMDKDGKQIFDPQKHPALMRK